MFFTIDGIDGTGKSTQADLFCEWLTQRGHEVVRCRDPGTTQLGERLRDIVLQSKTTPISNRSETLIYMAARAQLVHEIIRPSLEAGKVVVSDRFLLANVVYQAYGLDLEPIDIWNLGKFATQGLTPTKTFLLDLDVELAARRLQENTDRMERRGAEYFQRVRDGFLTEAKKRAEQVVVLDASRSIEDIQADIRSVAKRVLHQ